MVNVKPTLHSGQTPYRLTYRGLFPASYVEASAHNVTVPESKAPGRESRLDKDRRENCLAQGNQWYLEKKEAAFAPPQPMHTHIEGKVI